MSVKVPEVCVGEYCERNMHDLCNWDKCQCGCHVHKKIKIEKLKYSELFIKDDVGYSPEELGSKVKFRNETKT